ncbi:hypothetical protein [Aquimarina intermedia]|uniref:Uncharacterized protein n=1 Tax=Aquimarina intermedia TaxID=350814 RepID=A0A5S5C9B3_9FLAO|nr:hypothetical protein [Aquimarina intermedia]TYP75208.1 hypothetical protein BD809_103272 [Aquimarina intermedia]
MKKVILLLSLTTILFTSCEGDQGPPGLDGLQGEPGISILAQVFEGIGTFNSANNYTLIFDYPSNIDVFESDVALVYLREEVNNGLEVWTPLPRTFYFDTGGFVEYNFNFTIDDVAIFLDSDINFGSLDPIVTDDQIFRIVIVPGEFAKHNDTSDINSVLTQFNLQNTPTTLD